MNTSDNIQSLQDNEIFVFWSNWKGHHDWWTARLAVEKFWAIYWQSEWIQWQSFAINTMDWIDKIKEWIEKLKQYASKNTDKIFYLTKIWCWIAWYKEEDIKPLVQYLPANIILPKEFTI